ncbi:MAG: flagellar biosynthetic protein FliR [Phycisphaerae bacterium]
MMNDSMQLLQMLTNLPLLALVMARISGLVAFAPFFSDSQIPINIRVLLSAVITIVVLPFASANMPVPTDLGSLVLAMIGELLIGLTFGLMLTILFSGLELAGILIGQQVGIALAQVFNPLFEEETSVLGQLYFFLALIIFLLIRGHMMLIAALVKSFHTIPPGHFVVNSDIVTGLVDILRLAFILALQVSAPILVAIFLATLAIGFVGRTVPQLNILSVGFSLRSILGFLLIIVCLTPAVQVFFNALDTTFKNLYRLMELKI